MAKFAAPYGMSRTREQALALIQTKVRETPAPYGLPLSCQLWQGYVGPNGYAKLRCDGRDEFIHRIVCGASADEVARHLCDRKHCVEPSHILKGTHADNVDDKVAKQRHCFGSKHYRTTIDEETVRSIRLHHKAKIPLKINALDHGVSESCIKGIVYGRTWKHVT